MERIHLQKEVIIAATLLACGVLILPAAVYWVGQQLIGEYAGAGFLDLAETIWWDLLNLHWAAWTLVLSPYLTVQLVRLTRFAWRPV